MHAGHNYILRHETGASRAASEIPVPLKAPALDPVAVASNAVDRESSQVDNCHGDRSLKPKSTACAQAVARRATVPDLRSEQISPFRPLLLLRYHYARSVSARVGMPLLSTQHPSSPLSTCHCISSTPVPDSRRFHFDWLRFLGVAHFIRDPIRGNVWNAPTSERSSSAIVYR